jgi:putative transposase
MGISTFQAGTLVQIQQKTYRLLRQVEDQLWQIEEVKTNRIHEYSLAQLQSLYAAGQLIFANPASHAATNCRTWVQGSEPLGKDFDLAKIRRTYAMAAMDVPNTPDAIKKVIADTWAVVKTPGKPPHWTTVYRWKTKLQKSGKDIRALMNLDQNRGNRTSRYPKEVVEFANDAIEKHYLTEERKTIQDALDAAVVAVLQENRLRPDSMQLPLPTRRLVTSLIEAIPAFDRYAARHGRVAATKRFRSVLAHRTTKAPLERAEIDHTPLDLMVVDDRTGLPLGRPYLTVCLDDYTRCILGVHIGFEPPSYLTVARCLRNAFLPKTDLLEKYPNIRNPWLPHGVMRELTMDNGTEFHSLSLEKACFSLGIEMHYSARKTPWFKGKVERLQGTINRAIAHGNPGTTFSNIFDKEDYDPSTHAVIRYSVLKEIVHMWVTDVYHQKTHRSLKAPPAVVWQNSIKPEDILLPDDPAELDAIMGRSEERRLTHKGIELYGLIYNSADLTDLRRKLGDKLDVDIRVDEADLGQIIVFSPDKTRFFKVPSITQDYAKGLSAWQHRVCKKFAAREMEKYDTTGWLEAKMAISRLIDEEFMHKKQKTRTKIARFNDGAKAIPQAPQIPIAPPVAVVAVLPVKPITLEDIAPIAPSTKSVKRFKPIQRERLPQLIAAEHAGMTGDNHD